MHNKRNVKLYQIFMSKQKHYILYLHVPDFSLPLTAQLNIGALYNQWQDLSPHEVVREHLLRNTVMG